MNNERILKFGFALLFAAALSGMPKGLAEEDAAVPANGSESAATVQESDSHAENGDAPRQKKRKEVRVERRGQGGRVHMEERNENGDVLREFRRDEADDGDVRGRGGRIQRFEFRGDDFGGPNGGVRGFRLN